MSNLLRSALLIVGLVLLPLAAVCVFADLRPPLPPVPVAPTALEQAQKFCDYDGVKSLSPAGEYTIIECGDERTTLITGG